MALGCHRSPCYTPTCSCPAPHCCSLPSWGSPSLFPFWPCVWHSASLPPVTTCHQLPCLWCEDCSPPAPEFYSRTLASRVSFEFNVLYTVPQHQASLRPGTHSVFLLSRWLYELDCLPRGQEQCHTRCWLPRTSLWV